MTTCEHLQTALMRDLLHDIHDLAMTYDHLIGAHLSQPTTALQPERRAEERHACQAKAAQDLDRFLAALTRVGHAHRDRIII